MKKLILFPLFVSFAAFSAGPEIQTKDEANQIISNIKDYEISNMLEESKEFKDCREMNKYEKDDKNRDDKIQKAQDCFKLKIGKDPKKLKKLAEELKLQQYKLVKSENAKDIQEYLNNKMYKSMTGIDPAEKDKQKMMENLKFKNRKVIDQAVFIRLYKMQLTKNALFEISRFCFEDFRLKNPTNPNAPSFGEYWKDDFGKNISNGKFAVGDVDDSGTPSFGATASDPEKKDKIYEDMFKSMDIGKFPQDKLKDFFVACSNVMVELCDDFKKSSDVKTSSTESFSEIGTTQSNKPTKGAAACLAKSRLQELRTAINNTGKVEEQFGEMQEDDKINKMMAAMIGEPIKLFTPGKDGSESLDNLTNFTSSDMIEGGADQTLAAKIKECELTQTSDQCKSLLGDEESFEKARNQVETEMTLRRDVEMARVRALKTRDKQELKDYLKENGFFTLLEKYDAGGITVDQIEEEIGKEFEAKKIATLAEMNKKIGSRQAKSNANDQQKNDHIKKAAEDVKSERLRLAQVVLFNNIITSHLELERKTADGKTEKVGRNVNAWTKEEKALEKAQVDAKLFQNLKSTTNTQGNSNQPQGVGDNEQLGGLSLIDKLLGKTKDD